MKLNAREYTKQTKSFSKLFDILSASDILCEKSWKNAIVLKSTESWLTPKGNLKSFGTAIVQRWTDKQPVLHVMKILYHWHNKVYTLFSGVSLGKTPIFAQASHCF